MEIQSEILESLSKTGDLYQLKIGKMCVVMEYSENDKSFNESMLNILKQKVKEG